MIVNMFLNITLSVSIVLISISIDIIIKYRRLETELKKVIIIIFHSLFFANQIILNTYFPIFTNLISYIIITIIIV